MLETRCRLSWKLVQDNMTLYFRQGQRLDVGVAYATAIVPETVVVIVKVSDRHQSLSWRSQTGNIRRHHRHSSIDYNQRY